MRYFIVEAGRIVNIVVWDGLTPWAYASEAVRVPDGCALGIGDLWP